MHTFVERPKENDDRVLFRITLGGVHPSAARQDILQFQYCQQIAELAKFGPIVHCSPLGRERAFSAIVETGNDLTFPRCSLGKS
jgi:hypothetical protein